MLRGPRRLEGGAVGQAVSAKRSGPRGRAAEQPPFKASISAALGRVKPDREAPPWWLPAGSWALRGRGLNPHGPLERRLLYRLSYPASLIIYTVRGGVLFPASMIAGRRETGNGKGETGQKKGPGFPGPWAAYGCLSNGAQPSTRTYSNSYSAAVKSRARRPRPRPKMAGIGGHDTDFGRVPRRLLGTGNRYGVTLFPRKKKASLQRGLLRDRFSRVPVIAMVTEAAVSVKGPGPGFQAVPGDACLKSLVCGGGTRPTHMTSRKGLSSYPGRTRICVLDRDSVYPFNLPRIPTLNTVEREVLFPACLRAGRRETGGGG